jgi:peroxiredoxin
MLGHTPKTLISAVLAVALSFTVSGCAGAVGPDEPSAGPRKAPDFALEALEGGTVRLSGFRGQADVLLVFGATWCSFCVKEIPELNEVHETYKDRGLKLLSIDVQESKRKVASFAERYDISYTLLLDTSGEVASSYNVRGIPHLVFIDKKGDILFEGPRPRSGIMDLVERLRKG